MTNNNQSIQRTFIIGDEWLFLKIYTGYKTSDTILKSVIKPLTIELLEEKLIDMWFFIRYNDPEYHLRVRFHIVDLSKYSEIILRFNCLIKSLVLDSLIWKIQADTYNREIERYGYKTMLLSEELFFYDSTAIVSLIDLFTNHIESNFRWMIALNMIDSLLNDFKFSIEQKKDLLLILQNNFVKEFGFKNEYRKQLGKKYRIFKKEIETSISSDLPIDMIKLIEEKSMKSSKSIEAIIKIQNYNFNKIEINNFLSSHIHMMINRLFRTNQRKYELVLYDFLLMYYSSQIARLSKK